MHPANIVEDRDRVVCIDYTNYRNERRQYLIIPHSMTFGRTPFHPGDDQWLLIATDVDRNVVRTFAMLNIHSWRLT